MTKEVNDQLDQEFGIVSDEPVEVEVVKAEPKGIKKAEGEVKKDTEKDLEQYGEEFNKTDWNHSLLLPLCAKLKYQK